MSEQLRLKQIADKDPRYKKDAYIFVLEALHYTRQNLNIQGHVTGQQLLEGIRDLGLERYGAMAKIVFEHWGVKTTLDFGNIVINMVNDKVLNKTSEDSIDDFKDVYDFEETFVRKYHPDIENKGRNPRGKKKGRPG
ncbi:MAG: hypothetical protein JSV98_05010 [candidate division WOR-3 bacterium]|nr:MAG: hypothetical protein JSV98_05010 [candidate division WOR-3 bacterium]